MGCASSQTGADRQQSRYSVETVDSNQSVFSYDKSNVHDVDDDDLRLHISYSKDWAAKAKIRVRHFMKMHSITPEEYEFVLQDKHGHLFDPVKHQNVEELDIHDFFPVAFIFHQKVVAPKQELTVRPTSPKKWPTSPKELLSLGASALSRISPSSKRIGSMMKSVEESILSPTSRKVGSMMKSVEESILSPTSRKVGSMMRRQVDDDEAVVSPTKSMKSFMKSVDGIYTGSSPTSKRVRAMNAARLLSPKKSKVADGLRGYDVPKVAEPRKPLPLGEALIEEAIGPSNRFMQRAMAMSNTGPISPSKRER